MKLRLRRSLNRRANKKDGPTPAAGVGSGLEFVTGGAGADFSGKTAMPRYRFHILWTDRKNDDETGMITPRRAIMPSVSFARSKTVMVTMMPKANRMATLAILRASSARLNEDQVTLSAFVFVDRSIAR